MDSLEMTPASGDEHAIRIIKDDQGILILGDDDAVNSWLDDAGLSKQALHLGKQSLQVAANGLQAFGELASQSGRWVKLTSESAQKVAQYGSTGTGVLRKSGKIKHILKFENLSKASTLANPQMLTGVAGIMTQMALEQSIREITDYLETIDKKIDDLLQDQKDQSIANLVGVAHMVDETVMIRNKVGSVTDTTWSKIAGCPQDLVRAQGYALLKIEGLAKKLSEAGDAGEAERVSVQMQKDITEWTSILGNAVQLQDKLYVLELDRVMAERPETVEMHRQGIIEARRVRLHDIESKLFQLNASIKASGLKVREQKVKHPFAVTHTLQILDEVNDHVAQFAISVGIEAERIEIEMAPSWADAAGKLITDGTSRFGAGVKQLGEGAKRLGQGAAKLGGETTHKVAEGSVHLGGDAAKLGRQLGDGLSAGIGDASKTFTGLIGRKKPRG